MPNANASAPTIRVHQLGTEPPVSFAADELIKYLAVLTGAEVVKGGPDAGLKVGLMSAFAEVREPSVPNPRLDDALYIDVDGPNGIIAGNNPRSVLLAVYRYLTELGCRWVRPGADGERLPSIAALPAVRLKETASYRHRAVCIEGAVSYEHVRDMVAWLPKLGFNGYFIQFREAHTFFNRWYAHVGNPNADSDTLSKEQAGEYTQGIENEIARRGLLYHKVGHGWTCEPFGISGLGWEKEEAEPAPDVVQYLAQVNGERKLWHGVALNTNLCYSNPDVRRIMVQAIASYARENPDIDFLHVWLADGSNNNCECPACQQARPSDFCVTLMNEVDARLTHEGLATKIVFPIYVDLLWPPERERLEHPDRFVLMFAPIVRTYSETFRVGGALPELPRFERNKLDFPSSVASNVAFLKAWQAGFGGDSFDFDYHLMWDHTNDPGHMQIAQTISQDMKALRNIGLNGFVSCQIQRIFLPTGLPMAVMARTLWDRTADFDAVAADYFASAFGDDAPACRAYLTELSDAFDPPFLRGEKANAAQEAAEKLAAIPGMVASFMPTIERNLACEDPCHARSWFYLKRHAQLCSGLARALSGLAKGDKENAARLWAEVQQLAWEAEADLHPVFDAWLFTSRLAGRFSGGWSP